MPIPTPNDGETKDQFISRCMSALEGDHPDQDQRLAICFDAWRGENGGARNEED